MQQNTSLFFLFLLPFSHLHALAHLHQLGHVETVHVVHMWVDPSRLPEVHVVSLVDEFDEAFLPHVDIGLYDLYVSFLECVVDHFLVLEGRDGTGGVNNGSTYSRAVDGCQDKLLLDVGIFVDVQK